MRQKEEEKTAEIARLQEQMSQLAREKERIASEKEREVAELQRQLQTPQKAPPPKQISKPVPIPKVIATIILARGTHKCSLPYYNIYVLCIIYYD